MSVLARRISLGVRNMAGSNNIDYPDASPTYRGYRRQALYVLQRILAAEANVSLQPEFREDLAVYGPDGELQELVQVKDYSQPLVLSNLDPDGQNSFFVRCAHEIEASPDVKLTLASYGPLGPELKKAVEGNDTREVVAQKIADHGHVTAEKALLILKRLQVDSCSEAILREEIDAKLSQMVTAINPEEAVDALSFWVLLCSEKAQRITRDDLSKKVLNIGRFLVDMTAHEAEWLSTIRNIEDTIVPSERLPLLREEFHSGVAARYEHIQSELDVVRPVWMQALDEGFASCNVLFVHAPSGQGKTTLAYRYLKERCPGITRYEVKCIENPSHALRIARALGVHVRTLGLPVTVYLDIPPQHEGWLELIKELSFYQDIRILATIREEDWRRANVSGAEFRWHHIEMEFAEQEAREVFEHLTENSSVPQFVGFDEAWQRFGGQGPLLEFVYLITQGGLLRERLKEQIERIQDQVRQDRRNRQELNLLRMVSVASTFSSSLNARRLLKELQFPSSGNPLNLLEKEYLVRTSEDGLFIEGLHPIRSRIIADLLCDPITATWGETARECLPFLDYSFAVMRPV